MVFKNSEKEVHSKKSGILKKVVKNSIFPVSTIALFGMTVLYWNNQDYGLALEYHGQTVATMSNDKVYEQANHMIIDELRPEDKSKIETYPAQIKITPINKVTCCESPSKIKDEIIKQSKEVITEGYGIYIDSKLIAIGNDKDEIDNAVKEIIEEIKSQNEGCEVELIEKLDIKKGLFSTEQIENIEKTKNLLKDGKIQFTEYTVSEDDTIVGISEKFGISVEELLQSNNIENQDIAVGDKLKIKKVEKILNFKVFKTVTEEKEILYSSETIQDPSKETSFKQVTQEGKNGKEVFTYKVEYEDSKEVSRTETEHVVVEEPITEKITIGTKKPPKKSEFIWPVPFTKKITSPYGKRDGGFHRGIDIACAGVVGTDIVASQSGKIIVAKNGSLGYGNHIIIDHGNGKKTVYGHCQKLFVKQGQEVSQGDVIATVGSTGDSTGPHLHFEIRINNVAQDPQKYV